MIAFLRLATGQRPVLVVCNFTAVPRNGYRIGVPVAGRWTTLLNSDDDRFGGGGIGTSLAETEAVAAHGHDQSLLIDVPPLAVCFLAPD